MKRLYLARHAKSSWKNPGLTDFDRPLNKRGKRDAPFMGKVLLELGVLPDLILSSPAKRALKTAAIIAEEIDYPIEEIITTPDLYLTDSFDLLQLVHDLDDMHEEVMIFGHNPGLSELADEIGDDTFDNIPTSGILCIEFDISSWSQVSPETGKVIFFEYPKKRR